MLRREEYETTYGVFYHHGEYRQRSNPPGWELVAMNENEDFTTHSRLYKSIQTWNASKLYERIKLEEYLSLPVDVVELLDRVLSEESRKIAAAKAALEAEQNNIKP